MARPREFDPQTALDRIQRAFWEKGYHGTSMQDLERITELKKQSLYREFGNKDAMYARALKLYHERDLTHLAQVICRAPNAKQRFVDLFEAVLVPVRNGDRSGCFLCNSAIEHAHDDQQIQLNAQEGIQSTQDLFNTALAVSEPYKSDDALRKQKANLLAAGYFGLRVMVRGGTPLTELEETVTVLVSTI
ncbi:HTH-type transcriptional repressor ComR [Pseudovibrio sp. Ad13]|uniref:TetR/AcrR family transcriptional regulator n=1 Tax=Pseudovibrio sp. Ad13 TaxID=989396 RepID=UPI0007B30A78|nr:TetR/AcrR family transcriptional regulator [Pseudovibrio sp. Ad13]KZK84230.1 HTH-type transcriptional repressor ComR [Pseudovibrio sp. Ad13]